MMSLSPSAGIITDFIPHRQYKREPLVLERVAYARDLGETFLKKGSPPNPLPKTFNRFALIYRIVENEQIHQVQSILSLHLFKYSENFIKILPHQKLLRINKQKAKNK